LVSSRGRNRTYSTNAASRGRWELRSATLALKLPRRPPKCELRLQENALPVEHHIEGCCCFRTARIPQQGVNIQLSDRERVLELVKGSPEVFCWRAQRVALLTEGRL